MVTWVQRNPVKRPTPRAGRGDLHGPAGRTTARPRPSAPSPGRATSSSTSRWCVPLDKDVDVYATAHRRLRRHDRRRRRAQRRHGAARPVGRRSSASAASASPWSPGCAICRRLPDHRRRPGGRQDRVRQEVRRHARHQRRERRPGRGDPRHVRAAASAPASTTPSTPSARKMTMEQILQMARAPARPGEREGGTAVIVGVPHGDPATPPMACSSAARSTAARPAAAASPTATSR